MLKPTHTIMDDPQLLLSADPEWDKHRGDSKLFFSSTAWAEHLRDSMQAAPIYVRQGTTGFLMPVFRRGPFRIAYAGFPVSTPLSLDRKSRFYSAVKHMEGHHRPQVIRFTPGAFDNHSAASSPRLQPVATSIESNIINLQAWDISMLSASVRRNIRKAHGSGLEIRPAVTDSDATYLFDRYRDTVLRHGGQVRYSLKYFHSLIELASSNDALDCLVAELDGSAAGFIVTARHGRTSYYLHGAFSPVYQHLRPMDLLFATAVEQARSRGSEQFNFMASPVKQPSLVRYKEKWGAVSREQYTYDLIISKPHALLLLSIQKVIRHTPEVLQRLLQ